MDRASVRRWTSSFFLVALLAGCGDDPLSIEFQVIEDVEYAASLGIDLAIFTELPSGVYVQDVVVGTGDTATSGDEVVVGYTGYLVDGTSFRSGDLAFELGSSIPDESPLPAFQEGIEGMQLGGERRIIIPPELAYGAQARTDNGEVVVPAGSILIFDITLDQVN